MFRRATGAATGPWCRRRAARGLLALLLGSLVILPASAGTTFGARTQIWPFLFGGAPGALSADQQLKQAVTAANLAHYGAVGARWNIVEAWEGFDGPDGFARLDRVFAEHERHGIEVALRLLEEPEVYDAIAAGGTRADARLRDYAGWVGALAGRYGRRVRYYMVSNEVDHDIGFNRRVYAPFRPVTVAEYATLLRAARGAVQAAGSGLRVADHGVSSWSLAVAVMADLVLAGRPGDALAYWQAMEYAPAGEGERTLPALLAMLGSADSRRRADFARRSLAELGPWRDVVQLHHYHGGAVVPALLQWLRGRLTEPQAVVAGEVGCMIPTRRGQAWDGRPMNVADLARYSPDRHADALARSLAALAGGGIDDALYWQLRFHVDRDPVASLFPAPGGAEAFPPAAPALAFAHAAREFAAAAPVAGTPGLDARITEYRFGGPREFSVLWFAGPGSAVLPAGVRDRVAQVTDAAGAGLDLARWDGRIAAAPLYVAWRP